METLETEDWEGALRELMLENPGGTGGHYARELRDRLYSSVRKRDVNHLLYASAAYRNLSHDERPAWYLVDDSIPFQRSGQRPAPGAGPCPAPSQPGSGGWELVTPGVRHSQTAPVPKRAWGLSGWQREAHDAWFNAGCSGIVEAVTGSGKTRLAIAVIGYQLSCGRQILVLVPRVALQKQWAQDIAGWFPNARIQLVGGDGDGVLTSAAQVIVGVVNSVASHWTQFGSVEVVIADEVHNYGAQTYRKALLPHAYYRLGLTATLERLDGGVQEVLEPYFGSVCYRCGFVRAHADGRLATARIGLVGVHFSSESEQAYGEACETMRVTRRRLIASGAAPARPFGDFMAAVSELSQQRFGGTASITAAKYLKARKQRSDLLAFCPEKLDMIVDLSETLRTAGGTLVFAERVAAADALSSRLQNQGLQMPAYHSEVPVGHREVLLARLRQGALHGLCSAKALDEGIDVPDVDLGIIAAGTQQRRQMVQRRGRVLRPKQDGGPGRFLIAYVHGTIEDPATGSQEGFLELAHEIPGVVRSFPGASSAAEIERFLSGDDRIGQPLPSRMNPLPAPRAPQEDDEVDQAGGQTQPAELADGREAAAVEAGLRERIEELAKESRELNCLIRDLRDSKAQATREAAAGKEAAETEMALSRRRAEVAEDKAAAMESELTQLADKNSSLKATLEKVRALISEALVQKQELIARFKEVEQAHAEAAERVHTLESQLDVMRVDSDARQGRLDEAMAQVEELVRERDTAKGEREALQAQIREVLANREALAEQQMLANAERDSYRQQVEHLLHKTQHALAVQDRLEAENKELRGQLEDARRRIEHLVGMVQGGQVSTARRPVTTARAGSSPASDLSAQVDTKQQPCSRQGASGAASLEAQRVAALEVLLMEARARKPRT